MFLLLLGSVVYFHGTGIIIFSGRMNYCFCRPTVVLTINHQLMFIMRVWSYLVWDWVGYLGRYQ